MAQNEIIRKDFGDKNQNLAPDFSQAKPASVERAEIWMTPELKEAAAKALQNSWEISHVEQMATLNIRDVELVRDMILH